MGEPVVQPTESAHVRQAGKVNFVKQGLAKTHLLMAGGVLRFAHVTEITLTCEKIIFPNIMKYEL